MHTQIDKLSDAPAGDELTLGGEELKGLSHEIKDDIAALLVPFSPVLTCLRIVTTSTTTTGDCSQLPVFAFQ